jgi:hypothetical protein
MDFNELQRVWDECDRRLASGFHLNTRRLRSIVTSRAEANASRRTAEDIDYTMPVVLARKQLHAHPVTRFVRNVAASFRHVGRAGQIAGQFEAAVMRLLRHYRTLRH